MESEEPPVESQTPCAECGEAGGSGAVVRCARCDRQFHERCALQTVGLPPPGQSWTCLLCRDEPSLPLCSSPLVQNLLSVLQTVSATCRKLNYRGAADEAKVPLKRVKRIWKEVWTVARCKLRLVALTGDCPPRERLLEGGAWRAVHLAVCHLDSLKLLPEEWVVRARICGDREQWGVSHALLVLIQLAHRHGLANARTVQQRRDVWEKVHQQYCELGLVSSCSVLQLRFHELRIHARRAMHAYVNDTPNKSRPVPSHVYRTFARRFPEFITECPPSWREVFQRGEVVDILPPPHMLLGTGAPRTYKGAPPTERDLEALESDDELELVEKPLETIDLSDDDQDFNGAPSIHSARARAMCTAVQEDLSHQLRGIKEYAGLNVGLFEDALPTERNDPLWASIPRVGSENKEIQEINTEADTIEVGNDSVADSNQWAIEALRRIDPTHVQAEIIFSDEEDDMPIGNDVTQAIAGGNTESEAMNATVDSSTSVTDNHTVENLSGEPKYVGLNKHQADKNDKIEDPIGIVDDLGITDEAVDINLGSCRSIREEQEINKGNNDTKDITVKLKDSYDSESDDLIQRVMQPSTKVYSRKRKVSTSPHSQHKLFKSATKDTDTDSLGSPQSIETQGVTDEQDVIERRSVAGQPQGIHKINQLTDDIDAKMIDRTDLDVTENAQSVDDSNNSDNTTEPSKKKPSTLAGEVGICEQTTLGDNGIVTNIYKKTEVDLKPRVETENKNNHESTSEAPIIEHAKDNNIENISDKSEKVTVITQHYTDINNLTNIAKDTTVIEISTDSKDMPVVAEKLIENLEVSTNVTKLSELPEKSVNSITNKEESSKNKEDTETDIKTRSSPVGNIEHPFKTYSKFKICHSKPIENPTIDIETPANETKTEDRKNSANYIEDSTRTSSTIGDIIQKVIEKTVALAQKPFVVYPTIDLTSPANGIDTEDREDSANNMEGSINTIENAKMDIEHSAKDFENPTIGIENPVNELCIPVLRYPITDGENSVNKIEDPTNSIENAEMEIDNPADDLDCAIKVSKNTVIIENATMDNFANKINMEHRENSANNMEDSTKALEDTKMDIENPAEDFEYPIKVLDNPINENPTIDKANSANETNTTENSIKDRQNIQDPTNVTENDKIDIENPAEDIGCPLKVSGNSINKNVTMDKKNSATGTNTHKNSITVSDNFANNIEDSTNVIENDKVDIENPAEDVECPIKSLNKPINENATMDANKTNATNIADSKNENVKMDGIGNPADDLDYPIKVYENTIKVIETLLMDINKIDIPDSVLGNPIKDNENAANTIEDSTNTIENTKMDFKNPAKDLENPTMDIGNLVNEQDTSKNVLGNSITDRENSANNIENHTNAVGNSNKDIESPAKDLENPTIDIENPENEIDIKDRENPANNTETSINAVENPNMDIENLAKDLENPTVDIENPANEIDIKDKENPANNIEKPTNAIENSNMDIGDPAKDIEIAIKVLETPIKVMANPTKTIPTNRKKPCPKKHKNLSNASQDHLHARVHTEENEIDPKLLQTCYVPLTRCDGLEGEEWRTKGEKQLTMVEKQSLKGEKQSTKGEKQSTKGDKQTRNTEKRAQKGKKQSIFMGKGSTQDSCAEDAVEFEEYMHLPEIDINKLFTDTQQANQIDFSSFKNILTKNINIDEHIDDATINIEHTNSKVKSTQNDQSVKQCLTKSIDIEKQKEAASNIDLHTDDIEKTVTVNRLTKNIDIEQQNLCTNVDVEATNTSIQNRISFDDSSDESEGDLMIDVEYCSSDGAENPRSRRLFGDKNPMWSGKSHTIQRLGNSDDQDKNTRPLSARATALLRRCRPVTVSLERLPQQVLDSLSCGASSGSGRVAPRVSLPDIAEVRRVNRRIATAQVKPITSVSSSKKHRGDTDDRGEDSEEEEGDIDQQEGERGTEDGIGRISPTALQAALNELERRRYYVRALPLPPTPLRNPAARHCCPARRHAAVNAARRRVAMVRGKLHPNFTELPIHRCEPSSCQCCCGPEALSGQHSELTRAQNELARLIASMERDGDSSDKLSDDSGEEYRPPVKKKPKPKPKRPRPIPLSVSQISPRRDDYAEWQRQRTLAAKYFQLPPKCNKGKTSHTFGDRTPPDSRSLLKAVQNSSDKTRETVQDTSTLPSVKVTKNKTSETVQDTCTLPSVKVTKYKTSETVQDTCTLPSVKVTKNKSSETVQDTCTLPSMKVMENKTSAGKTILKLIRNVSDTHTETPDTQPRAKSAEPTQPKEVNVTHTATNVTHTNNSHTDNVVRVALTAEQLNCLRAGLGNQGGIVTMGSQIGTISVGNEAGIFTTGSQDVFIHLGNQGGVIGNQIGTIPLGNQPGVIGNQIGTIPLGNQAGVIGNQIGTIPLGNQAGVIGNQLGTIPLGNQAGLFATGSQSGFIPLANQVGVIGNQNGNGNQSGIVLIGNQNQTMMNETRLFATGSQGGLIGNQSIGSQGGLIPLANQGGLIRNQNGSIENQSGIMLMGSQTDTIMTQPVIYVEAAPNIPMLSTLPPIPENRVQKLVNRTPATPSSKSAVTNQTRAPPSKEPPPLTPIQESSNADHTIIKVEPHEVKVEPFDEAQNDLDKEAKSATKSMQPQTLDTEAKRPELKTSKPMQPRILDSEVAKSAELRSSKPIQPRTSDLNDVEVEQPELTTDIPMKRRIIIRDFAKTEQPESRASKPRKPRILGHKETTVEQPELTTSKPIRDVSKVTQQLFRAGEHRILIRKVSKTEQTTSKPMQHRIHDFDKPEPQTSDREEPSLKCDQIIRPVDPSMLQKRKSYSGFCRISPSPKDQPKDQRKWNKVTIFPEKGHESRMSKANSMFTLTQGKKDSKDSGKGSRVETNKGNKSNLRLVVKASLLKNKADEEKMLTKLTGRVVKSVELPIHGQKVTQVPIVTYDTTQRDAMKAVKIASSKSTTKPTNTANLSRPSTSAIDQSRSSTSADDQSRSRTQSGSGIRTGDDEAVRAVRYLKTLQSQPRASRTPSGKTTAANTDESSNTTQNQQTNSIVLLKPVGSSSSNRRPPVYVLRSPAQNEPPALTQAPALHQPSAQLQLSTADTHIGTALKVTAGPPWLNSRTASLETTTSGPQQATRVTSEPRKSTGPPWKQTAEPISSGPPQMSMASVQVVNGAPWRQAGAPPSLVPLNMPPLVPKPSLHAAPLQQTKQPTLPPPPTQSQEGQILITSVQSLTQAHEIDDGNDDSIDVEDETVVPRCGLGSRLHIMLGCFAPRALPVRAWLRGRDPTKLMLLRVFGDRPLLRLSGSYLVVSNAPVSGTDPMYWTLQPMVGLVGTVTPHRLLWGDETNHWDRALLAGFSEEQYRDLCPTETGTPSMAAPSMVTSDRKIFKKITNHPLVYAQVLTAIPTLSHCRRLVLRNEPVWIMCARSGTLSELHREDNGAGNVGVRCDAIEPLTDLVTRFNRMPKSLSRQSSPAPRELPPLAPPAPPTASTSTANPPLVTCEVIDLSD